MVVHENLSRSSVSEILRPARLAPKTMPCSKSLKSLFLPILIESAQFELSMIVDHAWVPKCIELLPSDWLKCLLTSS